MIRVIVSLGDRLHCEGVADLLDFAGGIEAAIMWQGEDRMEAALRAAPDVVVSDPETLAGLLGAGCPEDARILLICGENEKRPQSLVKPPVRGVIRKGSSGLALQTAIKAVARGVVWVEDADEGVTGLAAASDGSQENQVPA